MSAVTTDRAGQTEAGHGEATHTAGQGEAGAGGHQAGLDISLEVERPVLSDLCPLPEEAPVVEEVTVGSHCSSVQLAVRLVQQAKPGLAVGGLQSGRQLDSPLLLLAGLSPGVGAGVALGEETLQPRLGGGG